MKGTVLLSYKSQLRVIEMTWLRLHSISSLQDFPY